jgi:hypothetical protein
VPLFARISEQQTWDSLVALNRQFHGGAFAPELAALLRDRGIDLNGCALVELSPDGGGTWIGSVVTADGSTHSFYVHENSLGTSDLVQLAPQKGGGVQMRRADMVRQHLAELLREATSNTSLERTRER